MRGIRQGSAVNRNERSVFVRTLVVNRPGQKFLSGTGRSFDQDGAIAVFEQVQG